MTTILRLSKPSRLISAAVFETLFERHHAGWFNCVRRSHVDWFDQVLGPASTPFPSENLPERFKKATRGRDFICPGFQATHLIPLLLHLRNRAGAYVRLLFITHSPGAFAYVFGLLPALLRPGDLIVAPSRHSARVITALVPCLAPWVHPVHHPIAPLPGCAPAAKKRPVRIVTLGRIVPDKLIHRQVEALALLVKDYDRDAEMIVAGETRNLDTGAPSVYARSLQQKVERLGLADRVQFPGVIRGEEEKGRLLTSADLMLYLSRTLEEAFPKASVEALGAGIPVVASNWNGFPEIIGACGALVDLCETNTRSIDISPADVARAVDRCLKAPLSAIECRRRAELFSAARSETGYRALVREAMQHDPAAEPVDPAHPAAPMSGYLGDGLLATLPFLANLTVKGAFTEYLAYARRLRRLWDDGTPLPGNDPGYNTDVLIQMALKKRLEHMYAAIPYESGIIGSVGAPAAGLDGLPVFERMAACAAWCADEAGVNACLGRLTAAGESVVLSGALAAARARGICNRTTAHAETWLLLHQQQPEQAWRRFQAEFDRHIFQEHEWPMIRLSRRILCALGAADRALPLLGEWLDRYPDSLGTGPLWLDYAAAAGNAREWDDPAVIESLAKAEALLGDQPALTVLKGRAMAARVAAGSAAPDAADRSNERSDSPVMI